MKKISYIQYILEKYIPKIKYFLNKVKYIRTVFKNSVFQNNVKKHEVHLLLRGHAFNYCRNHA